MSNMTKFFQVSPKRSAITGLSRITRHYLVPEADEAKQLGTIFSRYQNGQPARETSGPTSVVIKSLEGGNLN